MKLIQFLYMYCLLLVSRCAVICNKQELMIQLKQDLDSGESGGDSRTLDCLINPNQLHPNIRQKHKKKIEEFQQTKKQYWTGDCAFQTSGYSRKYWLKQLKEYYDIDMIYNEDVKQIQTQEEYDEVMDLQAHLCVLLRSLMYNQIGLLNFTSDESRANDIKCPSAGWQRFESDDEQRNRDAKEGKYQYCAVNKGSFLEQDKWHIFLGPSTIRVNGQPKWKKG